MLTRCLLAGLIPNPGPKPNPNQACAALVLTLTLTLTLTLALTLSLTRHALHSERRQLELRLQEESRRAQKAVESLEKLKREGLLGRLFSGGDDSNGDSHAQAKSLPVRLPPDAGRESRV